MSGLRWSIALAGAALVASTACNGESVEASAGSSSEDDGQGSDGRPGPDDGDDPTMVEDSGSSDGSGTSDGGDPPAPECGDGSAQAPEECDGSDLAGQTCEAMGAVGTLRCTDACTFDVCDCVWEDFEPDCERPVCGNGELEADEVCDGSVDISCADLGWYGGTLTCSETCEIDESGCNSCGDGKLDPEEACDGSDVAGATCEANGFVGGEVFCDDACALDLSHCGSCGDGVVDADEECEAGSPGFCTCTDACTIDEADCISLIITEILYAPAVDPEAKAGQWIELYNRSIHDWSMQGCVVTSDLMVDTFEIDTPLVIPSGGYATLGAGTEAELGFVPSFEMPVAVTLFNDGDNVTITCGELVVDVVTYTAAAPWPAPPPGTAIALGQLGLISNDDGASWCAATTAFGPGHFGTPGASNDCP